MGDGGSLGGLWDHEGPPEGSTPCWGRSPDRQCSPGDDNLTPLSAGQSYILMGQVGDDGRGRVLPDSFATALKAKQQKALSALETKPC